MSIKFKKPLNFFKYFLIVLGVLLVGLSCYFAYVVLKEPWGEPEGIRVTNVTSRSATVTWVTGKKAKGSVVIMEDGGLISGVFARLRGDIYYDDRDVSRVEIDLVEEMDEETVEGISTEEVLSEMKVRDMKKYYVHHVTISGLDPESEYYFKIGNGLRYKYFNKRDLSENSENSFKTYQELDEVPLPNPAYGGVKKQVTTVTHQEDVEEALVYIQAVDKETESVSNYLSAVTNKNGNWYIDLANARDKESGDVMKGFDERDFEMIDVEAGPEGSIEDRKIDADRDAPAVDLVVLREEELGEANTSTIDGVIGRVYAGECKCIDAEGGCWCNESCEGGGGWTPGSCGGGGSGGGSSSGGSSGGGGDEVPTGGTPGARCFVKYEEEGAFNANDGCMYECEGVGTYDQNGNCVNHWSEGSFCRKKDPSCGAACNGGEVCKHGESCAMGDYQCCTTGCVTPGQETGGGGGGSGAGGGSGSGGGCTKDQTPVPDGCNSSDYMVGDPSAGQCCGWCNDASCVCPDGSQVDPGVKCPDRGGSSSSDCDEVGDSCCIDYTNRTVYCYYGLSCNEETNECETEEDSGPGSSSGYQCEEIGDSCCWRPQRGNYCLDSLDCVGGECVSSGDSNSGCGSYGERACQGDVLGEHCPQDEAPHYTNGYCCNDGEEWIDGGCTSVIRAAECNEDNVDMTCYVNGHLGSCQANESTGQYAGNALFSGGSASVGCMLGALGGAVQNVGSGERINISVPLSYVVSAGEGAVNGCVEGAQDLGDLSDQGFDRVFTYSCQTGVITSNASTNEPVNQRDRNKKRLNVDNYYKVITNSVSAQESESTEEYTISSEGYLFSPNEDGIYTLELPDGTVIEDLSMSKDINYTFFVDSNSDGEITSDETVQLTSVTSIQVKKKSSLFNYILEDGYNFISFPFIPENQSSFDLIKELNESDGLSVTQLARYNSGKFEVTSFRSDIDDSPSGDNFPITPGWGYLLRVYGDGELEIAGQEVADSVELVFPHEGWYLSGVHGSSKSYTAESLIDSANEVEGLTVDNVTRWYTSTAKYEGLQKEKDEDGNSEVYGFDFAIEENKSYFVRVSELEDEEVRWKP